jgi:site-specific recombinase XerD
MARKIVGTWDSKRGRWTIWHGKRYTITPSALGCPATKEGSYQAFNDWWEKKKIEIDGQAQTSGRFGATIRDLITKQQWCANNGYDDEANRLSESIRWWQEMEADTSISHRDTSILNYESPDSRAVWNDRLRHSKQVKTDTTISHWVASYVSLRLAEVEAKQLSPSQFDQVKTALYRFAQWAGEKCSVETINPDKWVDFYKYLLALTMGVETKKKTINTVRHFVKWLQERHLISHFDTNGKRYGFKASQEDKETVNPRVIREAIDKADDRTKLLLLLMCNCGFNQVDISNLSPSQYANGVITRARSKTAKQKTITVSQSLWAVTRELLERYKETTGDRLFLTASGDPWVRDEIVKGQRSKSDNAGAAFKRLGVKGFSLKDIRATSGDLIKHQYDKEVADFFLKHGQNRVDGAYFSRSQVRLNKAINWLASQYGF